MEKELIKELIKIKKTQIEIFKELEEMRIFMQSLSNYIEERRKYLEKELNKKWWEFW